METPFGWIPDEHIGHLSMAEIHESLAGNRVSRRPVLRAGLLAAGAVVAGPVIWRRPGFAAVPPAGRHLVYGSDPQRSMTVRALRSDGTEIERITVRR